MANSSFTQSSISVPVVPNQGGTGVANNAASTITISGNFATVFTVTAATGVMLPTTGVLATLANSESLSNKTLVAPILSGTAASAGQEGYDATQKVTTAYGGATAVSGTVVRNIATGTGTQTLTNSTTADQDFTTIFTFPANSIFTSKMWRLTITQQLVTGVSTSTLIQYVKLGTTKIFSLNAANPFDGNTRTGTFEYLIYGLAAPSASSNVVGSVVQQQITGLIGSGNNIPQPIALATNGSLALNVGITFSATGSTDTVELFGWSLEELN